MSEPVRNRPTIALIAVFYNIREHALPCLESIANQTIQPDEVILIDDGSTDGTSDLLDEFASTHPARVIHRENGGPSAARNTGVREAASAYITFVDGDDILSPWYVEALRTTLGAYGDGVIVGGHSVLNEVQLARGIAWHDAKSLLDGIRSESSGEALRALLYGEIGDSSCAKLTPRSFCATHPFPAVSHGEDLLNTAELFMSATNVHVISDAIYGYVMHSDSLAHPSHASFEDVNEYLSVILELERMIRAKGEEFDIALAYREAISLARIYDLVEIVGGPAERVAEIKPAIRECIEVLCPLITRDARVPLAQRFRLLLLIYAPNYYAGFMRRYEMVRQTSTWWIDLAKVRVRLHGSQR